MNNNGINFDPMTGQPISQNNNISPNPNEVMQNQSNSQTVETQAINQQVDVGANQSIPNNITQNVPIDSSANVPPEIISAPLVEQSKEQFINNSQVVNQEKVKEKVKEKGKNNGINYLFVIILLAVLFIAIFFLFPLLSKNL